MRLSRHAMLMAALLSATGSVQAQMAGMLPAAKLSERPVLVATLDGRPQPRLMEGAAGPYVPRPVRREADGQSEARPAPPPDMAAPQPEQPADSVYAVVLASLGALAWMATRLGPNR